MLLAFISLLYCVPYCEGSLNLLGKFTSHHWQLKYIVSTVAPVLDSKRQPR